MEVRTRLVPTRLPADPEGLVLVLHGGSSRGVEATVSPAQLSVLRMVPIAQRIARAGQGRLAVLRVLNSSRGWSTGHTPVDDARWAMAEAGRLLGRELPTCLVGHSLGGRAALLAAGAEHVRSAVALAPWVYPDDVPPHLPPGRRLLIVHGDGDRVARPERSAAVARTLARTAEVGYVTVRGGKHAMLARGRVFESLAADWATVTLLDTPPHGTVARILAGESPVRV